MLTGSITGMTLNIIFNIIFIPKYGALGAVIALTLAMFFSSLVVFYFAFKLCPIPINWTKFISIFVILFIFSVPIYFIMHFDLNFS